MRQLPCVLIALVALVALAACDDAPPTTPATDSTACGMTLPGVGTWTVAEYDDGYLIDANSALALRTAADGRLWWHRLDGTDGGPVDLGAPFAQDQQIDLYHHGYVLVRGLTDDFEPRARLVRLADNRIVHETEFVFEGRGAWVITGNSGRAGEPRLESLESGRKIALPCARCGIEAVDRFGRVWIEDYGSNTLIEVELSSGRVVEHPNLRAYNAQLAGAGLLALDENAGRRLFGASRSPVTTCDEYTARIAATGHIACPRANDLQILDRDGVVIRTERDIEPWSVREFGTGFLTRGTDGAIWVPVDHTKPVVAVQGSIVATTSLVTLFRDREREQTTILHADGRRVTLDYRVNAPVEVAADGRFALIRRTEDFAVVDLDTGAVTLEVPLDSGWKRFVGAVLLIDGAPLGEPPLGTVSNLVFPDRRCPVMLFEHCDRGACALNIRQFSIEGAD